MSDLHALHITVTDRWTYMRYSIQREEVEYDYTLTCPGCDGWIECHDDHPRRCDHPECADFDICDEDESNDEIEQEFHGALHTYRGWNGWTLPYKGCVLADKGSLGEIAHDLALEYGSGDYLIDDDWDDTEVYLTAVSMADGSPLRAEADR